MLVFHYEDLIPIVYTNSDFQSDLDFKKSTSCYVFTLGGKAISWRSVKQSCITDSIMEAENVVACEIAKEVVWIKKFLSDLGVMRIEQVLITFFCDNNGAIAQSKDPRNHKKGKHIERKYHIIRHIQTRGVVVVAEIDGANYLADSFTKALPQRTFKSHLEGMKVRLVRNSL